MKSTIFTLSTLLTLTAAHFELTSPAARGFDEDNLPQFPCGGQNTVSATRTPFPLKGGSIEVVLGHITTNLEVLIAVGNDPGSAFNTIIRAPFYATGLGNLCISGLSIPSGLNLTAGSNATIQVQSNGDPDGGLYNCADITFVETLSTPEACKNGSITISAATVSGNPNGTAFGAGASVSSSSSASASASGSPTATSASASVSSSSSASASASGSPTATSASASASSSKAAGAGSVVSASLGGLVLAGAAALAIVL